MRKISQKHLLPQTGVCHSSGCGFSSNARNSEATGCTVLHGSSKIGNVNHGCVFWFVLFIKPQVFANALPKIPPCGTLSRAVAVNGTLAVIGKNAALTNVVQISRCLFCVDCINRAVCWIPRKIIIQCFSMVMSKLRGVRMMTDQHPEGNSKWSDVCNLKTRGYPIKNRWSVCVGSQTFRLKRIILAYLITK